MKAYFIFYVLLIILIILLIFVILLYSDYHTRTIVPALLSSNYKVVDLSENWDKMKIWCDVKQANGSILFGHGTNVPTNYNDVTFIPMNGDEKRKLVGRIILLMGSTSTSGDTVRLRIVDSENGNVIGKESQFRLSDINKWGLTPIRMNFSSDQIDSGMHQITVEALSPEGDTNTVVLNSAYVGYF